MRRQAKEWDKIFINHIPNKGLVSRIYLKKKKKTLKRANNSIRKWARHMKISHIDDDIYTSFH